MGPRKSSSAGCTLAAALACLVPCVLTHPARMWRVMNLNRIEIDWSVSELQFLSRTAPAPSDQGERTRGNVWPVGAADWQTPFECDSSSALDLADFPSHQKLSSYDWHATPVSAAFDGSVEFARSVGTSVWRSGVGGFGLNASAGYIGIDFGSDVDVRCIRLTQGAQPKWGSEAVQLQSSPDGQTWTDILAVDSFEYPQWEQGTSTLMITECQRAVPITSSGVLNFTGGFAAAEPFDCSWFIECGADEVASMQLSEVQTSNAADLVYMYDGDAYTEGGLGPGVRPQFVSTVPQLQNQPAAAISFGSYHGTLPSCVEDLDGRLSAAGMDCSDGSQCRECIPTLRGCRAGTSTEACPPIGSPSPDGRNSTCIAGSSATVHAGLSCAQCYTDCPSALFKLGGCGGLINGLVGPTGIAVRAPADMLLSDVCPNLCSSPCPGDLQTSATSMTVRYTGDGLGDPTAGFVGTYTCAPLDACDVSAGLGGDNSSCVGCDGIPNSGLVVDLCGVCAGDGTSCLGCDTIPWSGLQFDECGVCGGDRGTSCADPCNSTLGLHMENAGSIDFGSGYGIDHICEWHLFCPHPEDHILLSFSQFSTENTFDYVKFYEGPELDEASPLIDYQGFAVTPLSGMTIPGPYQSVGTSVSMTFTTNAGNNRRGWQMGFACGTSNTPLSPEDPCTNGVHMTNGGQVDFLGGYGPHYDCAWVLTCDNAANGDPLYPRLSFGQFHTQDDHDWVYVYDYGADNQGASDWTNYGWQSQHLMGSRCSGAVGPAPVIATGNALTLRFTSDGDIGTEGFDALYSCERTLNVGR